MIFRYAVCTTRGRVRKKNQDNFFLNGRTMPPDQGELSLSGQSEQETILFSVCDGMGGEHSGEVAASLAVEAMKRYPAEEFPMRWEDCIRTANREICAHSRKQGGRMGTTFTALSLQGRNGLAVNVGDSRIYQVRGRTIRQLSKDHTEFQSMVDANIFKKEDFANTKTHNHLTQHLGIEEWEMELEPYVERADPLRGGDLFLLCSDGLYGVMTEEEMLCILVEADNEEEACRELVDAALEQGSRDNVTALVVRVLEPPARAQFVERASSEPPARAQIVDHTAPEQPSPAPKAHKPWKGLLLLLIGAAVAAAAAGFVYFRWQHPVVCAVVSMTQEQAQESLTSTGLRVKTKEAYDASAEQGVVVSQSVEAGKRVPRGSTVTLVISKGAEPVEIPDVTGMTRQEAESALEGMGLSVQILREYSQSVETGLVIGQFPQEGTKTVPGATIKLTVSDGEEPVELPDVVGLFSGEARSRLEALGLSVRVKKTRAGKGKAGTVLSQTPEAGEKLRPGDTVVLEVSRRAKKEKKKKKQEKEKDQEETLTTVPDLKGMNVNEAWYALKGAGLKPEFDYRSSEEVAPGGVISQEVRAGTQVPSGTTVLYWVSKEAEEERS